MLINEQHIVLEARIQMRLKTQMHHDRVMMTVDVRIDTVETLEQLSYGAGKVFGKGNADAGGKGGFVVDVGLDPGHEVLDVLGCGHLGGFGKAGRGVLPEVFKSMDIRVILATVCCRDWESQAQEGSGLDVLVRSFHFGTRLW